MPVLAGGCRKQPVGDKVVPLALETRAAHLRQIQVAQDDECPGAHVGARLESLARRPGLEKRLLHQIVG